MDSSLPREGQFAPWEVPALLRGYVRHLRDGRLELTCDGTTRSIWLDAGQVRAVVSQASDERLGSWLAQRGVLTQEQLAVALLRIREGALFGTALVTEGFLDLDRLQKELEARITTILTRLLPAAGSFTFSDGERFAFESVELTLSSASFLLAAAREVQPASQLHGVIDESSYLRRTEDLAVAFQKVQLLPHEAFLLSRIDGSSTLAQISRCVPVPQEALLRGIVALWAGGFVEVWGSPAQRPATPPPPPPEVVRVAEPPAPAPGHAEFSPLQRKEREDVLHLASEIRFQSFYRRLGIETGARNEQVQHAFADLARRFHPDRAAESHLRFLRRELAEVYACLEEACETLGDGVARAAYDRRLQDKRTLTDDPFQSEKGREEARRQIVAANIRKAEELGRTGDTGGAVTLLEQAVRFDPQPATLVALARLQLKNPMWTNRALDHLRHAVAASPRCTDAWLELARFWVRRGQGARARECVEKILAYDPGHAEALEIRGSVKAGRNR